MKITNQIKIIVVLLFISINSYSNTTTDSTISNSNTYFCGGGEYYGDNYYFNLFNQENISQKAFYPFLRADDQWFHAGVKPYESENIRLWYQYFNKKYTKEVLANNILGDTKNGFSKDFKNEEKATQFINYLKFAKRCEIKAKRKSTTWNYTEILKTKEEDISELLEVGMELFENEKDKSIKLRYAYQLIRLHHYQGMNTEAINFFNENVASLYPKNEIYYYILDQIGGCYYNLKKYEKAAYIFLTVFDKSFDRKTSAFTSYKFCTYRGAEGKSLLKNEEEKANQIFITALRQFSDRLQDLREIRDLGANENQQELLVMRIINNIERDAFSQDYIVEKNLMNIEFKTKEKIKKILNFIDTVLVEEPKNKEFWQLTSSYLSFLSGNLSDAKLKLQKINSEELKKQKESLKVVYEVFSWENVSSENEKWLGSIFKEDLKSCDRDSDANCNLHGFIFKQLSHYYFKNNDLAKAFLVENYITNIHGISSHELVDQLMDFVKKPNKNSFEKLLLKEKSQKDSNEISIIVDLKRAKGEIYFRSGDFNKALPFFNKEEEANIPSTVFSNNIMECFNCEASRVMEDKVYKAEFFSFLNEDMTRLSLLKNLKKLEEIALNESEKKWKRKLANYLLANYFFNVSNTGYYRVITYGRESNYFYQLGQKKSTMDEVISKKEDYYFSKFPNTYNNLASKSKAYYRKTIAFSEDEELNARCSYMIAKCELNYFYNKKWKYDYSGYHYEEELQNPTREGFDALKTNYKNTKFYKEIKSKCSFFRVYDAQ